MIVMPGYYVVTRSAAALFDSACYMALRDVMFTLFAAFGYCLRVVDICCYYAFYAALRVYQESRRYARLQRYALLRQMLLAAV